MRWRGPSKTRTSSASFDAGCCESLGPANANCYRAQCFHTARELAARLSLEPSRFSVSFQSRLGRTPWIRPFTDHVLAELPARGVKRLAVVEPSFVADCLETLEEIGQRAAQTFKDAGGEQFALVPAVNDDPRFMDGLAEQVRQSVR